LIDITSTVGTDISGPKCTRIYYQPKYTLFDVPFVVNLDL